MILSSGLLIGILIGHTLVIPSLFVAPFTGGIIIGVFSIWEKPEWIKNVFLFLGKQSTNIWLIHMFFYQYIFVNLVFVGQWIIPGLSEPPVRTLRATIPENESHIFR